MKTLSPSRRGFTLIEFLTVAFVIVTGIALIAPAIQKSQATARMEACKNNLKMLGIALHNYHDTHAVFPPGWVAKTPKADDAPRFGWMSFLLPYVEQYPLYGNIDFHRDIPVMDDNASATDKATLQATISVYRCPADVTSAINTMRGNYGTSNYSANHGDKPLPRWTTGRMTQFWPGQADTPQRANGIMYWNSSTRFRDITDGSSNTFMVGERCVTSAAGIWPGVGSNHFENDAVTECSHASRLNQSLRSFSSGHKGGAMFVMCDGSVHFITDDIDSQPSSADTVGIYQRLANRHDGMVVEF